MVALVPVLLESTLKQIQVVGDSVGAVFNNFINAFSGPEPDRGAWNAVVEGLLGPSGIPGTLVNLTVGAGVGATLADFVPSIRTEVQAGVKAIAGALATPVASSAAAVEAPAAAAVEAAPAADEAVAAAAGGTGCRGAGCRGRRPEAAASDDNVEAAAAAGASEAAEAPAASAAPATRAATRGGAAKAADQRLRCRHPEAGRSRRGQAGCCQRGVIRLSIRAPLLPRKEGRLALRAFLRTSLAGLPRVALS